MKRIFDVAVASCAILCSMIFCVANADTSDLKPTSVKIINIALNLSEWEVGDIEVRFSNGKAAVLTTGGKCSQPKISKAGEVGWVKWNDFDDSKYHHSSEKLVVRNRQGGVTNFYPIKRFISDWCFDPSGVYVAIASMDFHGHETFVRYNLETHVKLDEVNEYKAYNDLPIWAKPISDDAP